MTAPPAPAPSWSPDDPSPITTSLLRLTRLPRWIPWLIGILLICAAIIFACTKYAFLQHAIGTIPNQSISFIIYWFSLLTFGVFANLVLSASLFTRLTRPFAPITSLEMLALIASGTLVNYIPLRPGLFARVAYHRTVNNIPVPIIIRILLNGTIISLLMSAIVAALAFISWSLRAPAWTAFAIISPLLIALSIFTPRFRILSNAAIFKLFDIGAWTIRYVAAFTLIGHALPVDSALCLACAGTLANSIPFIGNGLGIREWTIALLAPLLSNLPAQGGAAAELVNRAIELLVVIPAGSLGFLLLARFTARWKSTLHASPGA